MSTSGARSRGRGDWSGRGRKCQRRNRGANPPQAIPHPPRPVLASQPALPRALPRPSDHKPQGALCGFKPLVTQTLISPFSHRSLRVLLVSGGILARVAFSPKESYPGRVRNITLHIITPDQPAYPPGFLRPGTSFGRRTRLRRMVVPQAPKAVHWPTGCVGRVPLPRAAGRM